MTTQNTTASRFLPLAAVMVAVFAPVVAVTSRARADCTWDCKEHNRFCANDFFGGGVRFFVRHSTDPGEEPDPIDVAFDVNVQFPDGGTPGEMDAVDWIEYEDCSKDCNTDMKATGSPSGDESEPAWSNENTVCGGGSSG